MDTNHMTVSSWESPFAFLPVLSPLLGEQNPRALSTNSVIGDGWKVVRECTSGEQHHLDVANFSNAGKVALEGE
jgi:hypothetical protein